MKLFCSCILMAVVTLSVVVLIPTKAFGLGLPPLPSLAAGILFITIPAISCNFWISFSMDPTEIFVNV
jgi:hypothetical protein